MVFIHRSAVPQYLHNSALFQLLDPNDEEEFEVPEECFKPDINLTSLADLRQYLQAYQFWGIDSLDDSALIYMYRNCNSDVVDALQKEFYQIDSIFTLIKRLQNAYPQDLISEALMCHASVDFIAWLHEEVYSGFSESDCAAAAKMNNLPALKYLHEHGCPGDEQTILAACEFGHIPIVEFAVAEKLLCSAKTLMKCMNKAAEYGQIDVLKYFKSLGFPFGSDELWHAVKRGDLSCVQYLIESGCWKSAMCTAEAARAGNLACLKYLHEHDCEWNEFVTIFAASGGHVECLNYAHTHGCPVHESCMRLAACRNHLECLQYLHTSGFPCTYNTITAARQSRAWRCFFYAVKHATHWEKLFIYIDAVIYGVVLFLFMHALLLKLL